MRRPFVWGGACPAAMLLALAASCGGGCRVWPEAGVPGNSVIHEDTMIPDVAVVDGIRFRALLTGQGTDRYTVTMEVTNLRLDPATIRLNACFPTMLYTSPPRAGVAAAWDERAHVACPDMLSIVPLPPGGSERLVHSVSFAGTTDGPPPARYYVAVVVRSMDPETSFLLSAGSDPVTLGTP